VKTILVLCCALLAAACTTATQAPSATPAATVTATPTLQATATATATATPTPAPSPTLAPGVKQLDAIRGQAVASPDGKWIGVAAAGSPPHAFSLYDVEGKLVRTIDLPTPTWTWLPDSSGILVALDTPQRAPSLGVIEVASGGPRNTGLQMSNATLSRDGRWIVAEHQEGCCVAIETKEIWAAPRSGGPARVLARTKSGEQQPIAILGVDLQGRVIYRDTDEILTVPVAGGTPQRVGTTPGDWRKTFIGTTSPDGTVVMVVTVDPAIWSVVSGDRATAWPSSAGEIVAMPTVDRRVATTPVWTADRSLLVRTSTGGLSAVNVVSLEQTSLAGKLMAADVPLAYRQLKLLVARGREILVVDIASNAERPTGIAISARESVTATALPSGGFVVSADSRTYRID
jgi:hypothetical protein